MARGTGIGGFAVGAVTGWLLVFVGACVLWGTREVWFEAPDRGDSLQYFDLMIGLFILTPLALPPGVLLGGLFGAWWMMRAERKARRAPPS